MITAFFLVALVASCGNDTAQKEAANELLKIEINQMDSISEVLEQSGLEIDASRDELNSLLEEL